MSQFSRETAVERRGKNLWTAQLCRGWRIGAVPNGGYVLAIAGRVLSEALPHRDPLTVTGFYLRPAVLGAIDCQVEILRQGRNTSFAEVKMYQQGELRVKVSAAYTDLDRQQGESWSAAPRPQFTAWDQCPPSGQKIEFKERVELRLASGSEVFRERRANGSGEFRGWVAHRDGSAPDPIALLLFADALPPPALTLFGPLFWVPTVELTVQVRAAPAPGPIQARLSSHHLTRGVVEADGEFWDSTGNLVALSRQTAILRVPPGSG